MKGIKMQNEVWESDKLKRREEAQEFLNYLKAYRINKPTKSLVLNIDAEWGFGKTYMLENMHKQLQNEGIPCAFYDAWSNDFSNEPMISFMLEVKESLKPFVEEDTENLKSLEKIILGTIKIGAKALTKKYLNIGADELEELSKISIDQYLVDEVTDKTNTIIDDCSKKQENIKATIKTMKNELKSLANSFKNTNNEPLPLVIFIDELDRCRPNYAIELLESIKHIFEVEGVFFVMATDTKQLANAFNAVYGNNYDTKRYLKRFFNMEYKLKKPDGITYATMLFDEYIGQLSEKLICQTVPHGSDFNSILIFYFSFFAQSFSLSYRDQKQCLEVLEAILLTYDDRDLYTAKKLHFLFLIILIIIRHQNPDALEKIKSDMDLSSKTTKSFSALETLHQDYNLNYDNEKASIVPDTDDEYAPNPSMILTEYSKLFKLDGYSLMKRGYHNTLESKIINSINNYSGNAYPFHVLSTYPDIIMSATRYVQDEKDDS